MILERAENPEWLSNAYLIAEGPGGKGVLVDSNQSTDPLVERIESDGIEITHVLLTHHHYDHVVDADKLAERFGVPVAAHELTAKLLDDGVVTETFTEGDTIESGSLRFQPIHTPGHCADHTALKVNETDVLTADVLFNGTVGGTMAPGATGFEDLKSSILDKLMKLPPEMGVHPGHTVPSTIGDEWEQNPFIRVWRGLDEEGTSICTVGPPDEEDRREATLVLWAPDYDGGNKAWVRFADTGEDAVVGGSQVKRS